jgi:hypothetical protein
VLNYAVDIPDVFVQVIDRFNAIPRLEGKFGSGANARADKVPISWWQIPHEQPH